MRIATLLLLLVLYFESEAQDRSIGSLITACETASRPMTNQRISAFKKSRCYQKDFRAFNFWEFQFTESISVKDLVNGTWLGKIRPTKRGYSQISVTGVRQKNTTGFSSLLRIAGGTTNRLVAISDDQQGVFCEIGKLKSLHLDRFIVDCLANGTVDQVIWLPQSYHQYVGLKGDKCYLFIYEESEKAYKVVDFSTYFRQYPVDL